LGELNQNHENILAYAFTKQRYYRWQKSFAAELVASQIINVLSQSQGKLCRLIKQRAVSDQLVRLPC
jgi:hypothetical protein